MCAISKFELAFDWKAEIPPKERLQKGLGDFHGTIFHKTVFLFFRGDVSPLHIIIIAIAIVVVASTTPCTYAAVSASRLIRDLCLRAIYGSANNCAHELDHVLSVREF